MPDTSINNTSKRNGVVSATVKSQPPQQHMPMKQKMAVGFKSLVTSVLSRANSTNNSAATSEHGGEGAAPMAELFTKTDPATDGDDCLHDCTSCSVKYPRNFKIDEEDVLYGHVKEWSTHVLVATGKTDWVRDSADEKGSVMEAISKAHQPSNGKMKVSASNMPTPNDTSDYSEPTTLLLLPAFTLVHNVQPTNVSSFISDIVNLAPTNTTPMKPFQLPLVVPGASPDKPDLTTGPCPHKAVILLCSQKTRDARCGQSAPLLRKELERHLRPLGLARDLHDERPGGVGIYFIDHVGGHKYSANVMIYRRPNAFGQDDMTPVVEHIEASNGRTNGEVEEGGKSSGQDFGATQCIWLARIRPEDCENLVRYTVLKGKVVKPEMQLRGGFDRNRGLMSW